MRGNAPRTSNQTCKGSQASTCGPFCMRRVVPVRRDYLSFLPSEKAVPTRSPIV